MKPEAIKAVDCVCKSGNIGYFTGAQGYQMGCFECKLRGPFETTTKEAVIKWNAMIHLREANQNAVEASGEFTRKLFLKQLKNTVDTILKWKDATKEDAENRERAISSALEKMSGWMLNHCDTKKENPDIIPPTEDVCFPVFTTHTVERLLNTPGTLVQVQHGELEEFDADQFYYFDFHYTSIDNSLVAYGYHPCKKCGSKELIFEQKTKFQSYSLSCGKCGHTMVLSQLSDGFFKLKGLFDEWYKVNKPSSDVTPTPDSDHAAMSTHIAMSTFPTDTHEVIEDVWFPVFTTHTVERLLKSPGTIIYVQPGELSKYLIEQYYYFDCHHDSLVAYGHQPCKWCGSKEVIFDQSIHERSYSLVCSNCTRSEVVIYLNHCNQSSMLGDGFFKLKDLFDEWNRTNKPSPDVIPLTDSPGFMEGDIENINQSAAELLANDIMKNKSNKGDFILTPGYTEPKDTEPIPDYWNVTGTPPPEAPVFMSILNAIEGKFDELSDAIFDLEKAVSPYLKPAEEFEQPNFLRDPKKSHFENMVAMILMNAEQLKVILNEIKKRAVT